jgi:hypothetical protein
MRKIKTYRKVGAFYIACEEEWLLKNSPTGGSFDLGDFPVGVSLSFFYLRSQP